MTLPLRRRRRRLVVGAACLGAAVGVLPVVPVLAAGSGTVTTAPRAEAWFRPAVPCPLAAACPAAPGPYPPDTLHVGVAAGVEESRTHLQLDLGGLPPGTKPGGGQLRLPVAGSQDGTTRPEAARLQACLLLGEVVDVEGSTMPPPEPDCTASSPAVFVPAEGDVPAAFTVDLGVLAPRWQSSPAPGALALLPAADTTPADSWHVAFSDRTRTGEGVTTITAAVTFASQAVDVEEEPLPEVTAPIDQGLSSDPPAFSGGTTDTGFSAPLSLEAPPVAPLDEPPMAAPQVAAPAPAPTALVPVALLGGPFRYPAVFLLPLLFAAAAAWAARAMTRDLDAPA